MDLWCEGLKYRDISAMLGITLAAVGYRMKAARAKIPGEREGQKQAAWRRECTPGS